MNDPIVQTQAIPCPACGENTQFPPEYVAQYGGQQTQCVKCGSPMLIPMPFSAMSPTAAIPSELPPLATAVPVLSYRGIIGDEGPGVYRDGKVVRARSEAVFPDRCVKCNAASDGRVIRRKVRWHPPWVFLVLLTLQLGVLIYIIVALATRKSGVVHVYLCQRHRTIRFWTIIGAWLSIPLATLLFVIASGRTATTVFSMIVTGILILVMGLFIGSRAGSIVLPKRIVGNQIWLRGTCQSFRNSLPDGAFYQ